MASFSRTLYVGVTSDIEKRVIQHRKKLSNFTSRYNANRLVYWEPIPTAMGAIRREKELKRWTRARKIQLVESRNPRWQDLAEEWHRKQFRRWPPPPSLLSCLERYYRRPPEARSAEGPA